MEISLLLVLLCFLPLRIEAAGTMDSNTDLQEDCDHEWSEWEPSWAGTGVVPDECVQTNVRLTRHCSKCHKEENKTVDTYGSHTFDEWHITKKPTPWAIGKKSRKCTRCHEYEDGVVSKRKMTSSEKKAVAAAKKLFTYAKSYNMKRMDACFSSSQPSTFFKDNKYMSSYCRLYNKKKLKISPVDVTVKGTKATVKLKVTYPDAYKPLLKTCEAMNWNGYSYHNKKGQAKMKKYAKKYTKTYGVGKQTKTINIYLKKTKKKGWRISSSTTNIKNAINCNYRMAFKDAK